MAVLSRTEQESWAQGMVRAVSPELIPATGAEDILNGFIDLTGSVVRRGGTTYKSTVTFGTALRMIWNGWLKTGEQQTILASTVAFGRLNGDGTITNLGGAGLTTPGRPAAFNGVLYLPGGTTYDGAALGAAAKSAPYYAIVANRLVAASGHTVYFSKINTPGTFEATDFHELPGGVQVLGVAAFRQSAAVFTTAGMWLISNMALNLTDASGNVQQRLDLFSADTVLWGNAGIAAWEGSLVVPATDAIYLVTLGVSSERAPTFVRLSDAIAPLYREYVRNGAQPGQAVVFRNHYLLPILEGSTVVDVLVCRLDMPASSRGAPNRPWTHFKGYGAEVAALAVQQSTGGVSPVLLGARASATARVLTCNYFDPAAGPAGEQEPNGTVARFSLTTRAYMSGTQGLPNFIARLRARYQLYGSGTIVKEKAPLPKGILRVIFWKGEEQGKAELIATGGPFLTVEVAPEQTPKTLTVWGRFVWGVGIWGLISEGAFELLKGEAPPSPDASAAFEWFVGKRRRLVRFRLVCEDPGQMVLHSLSMFTRQQGRI